jgi:uncharacterized protein YuzE
MKVIGTIFIFSLILSLIGCGGTSAPDQFTPEGTLQAVFDAARTKNFSLLANLCDPEGENDGDTQMICDLATSEQTGEVNRDMFVEVFQKGKIMGRAEFNSDGTRAEVEFFFGPDGNDEETMNLIKREGQWYLLSF